MDNDTGKEILGVIEAQKIIKEHRNCHVVCNDERVAQALLSVLIAMKRDDYCLIQLDKLLDRINEIARTCVKEREQDEAEIYLECLEDFTKIIEECLKGD